MLIKDNQITPVKRWAIDFTIVSERENTMPSEELFSKMKEFGYKVISYNVVESNNDANDSSTKITTPIANSIKPVSEVSIINTDSLVLGLNQIIVKMFATSNPLDKPQPQYPNIQSRGVVLFTKKQTSCSIYEYSNQKEDYIETAQDPDKLSYPFMVDTSNPEPRLKIRFQNNFHKDI